MKVVLKNQRTLSAIVALALAVVVTLLAGIKSYGETANEKEFILVFDDTAILERAIADTKENSFEIDTESVRIVKIFNKDNELVKSAVWSENESVEDRATQQILNQAEFLSAYGNTLVYKVSE